jgi:hypothetical protein
LALTAEGERLRTGFWRDLVEDPGPLAPLADSDLRTLAAILDALGVAYPTASEPAASDAAASALPGRE